MADALAERARERDRLLAVARRYVDALTRRVDVSAAAVVGSVARGDFNVWSDIDLVVIARELPERAPDRAMVLAEDAPPGLQAVGFSDVEFSAAWRKRNPLAREVAEHGVVLMGADYFRGVAEAEIS